MRKFTLLIVLVCYIQPSVSSQLNLPNGKVFNAQASIDNLSFIGGYIRVLGYNRN